MLLFSVFSYFLQRINYWKWKKNEGLCQLISLRKWKTINRINYSGICRPACGQNLYNITQSVFKLVRLKIGGERESV